MNEDIKKFLNSGYVNTHGDTYTLDNDLNENNNITEDNDLDKNDENLDIETQISNLIEKKNNGEDNENVIDLNKLTRNQYRHYLRTGRVIK